MVTKPFGLSENDPRAPIVRARSRARSRARFGAFAQRYVTSQTHAQGEDLERLVEVARPEPHWLALDIATGGGHTALRFAPHVGRVVATDLTARMLVAARRHVRAQADMLHAPTPHDAGNVAFGVADAEDLPFPARTFDLVTCRIAPHHFNDCARFVREGARVLVPGGLLLVQDHLVPEDEPAARYVDAFERLRDPSHHRAYARSEWVALFEGAGLAVEHAEQLVKTHELLPWAQRQDCSPETIERLVAMIERAPGAAIEWMAPRAIGTPEATFASHHILLAGRKRGR